MLATSRPYFATEMNQKRTARWPIRTDSWRAAVMTRCEQDLFSQLWCNLCLQSKIWLSFVIVGFCRALKALIFLPLYYIHRKPYRYFFQKLLLWGQYIWGRLYHVPKYTIFTLSRCWGTMFLPSSPNCVLSHSPHGNWMVDEPLSSQKEPHSWKMMKPRIHFSFPLLSLADSSHFYHSR